MKHALIAFIVLCAVPSKDFAQITLSGQTAAYVYKSGRTQSQRAVNNGRPSFGWQSYMFFDGYATDNVAALGTIRVTDDESINFDYLAIRLTDLTPLGLSIQAGKFDLPFGGLAERRFPRRNPLFGLPLIYEYGTDLPQYITTEAKLIAYKGRGYGMRLLDQGLYDLGAMLSGSVGIVDYAVAVTSGTVSATSYGTENSNNDFGKIVRIAITPMTGLTIGSAYAWGAYLAEPSQPPPRAVDVNSYQQKAAELDLQFSRGYAVINGEAVYSTWSVPFESRDADLNVLGYYLEGKYTIMTRVYLALRVSGLKFGDVTLNQETQPWDYNVNEVEGGVGYFIDRDVLLKLVRRETRIHGGSMPKDNLTVLQIAIAY